MLNFRGLSFEFHIESKFEVGDKFTSFYVSESNLCNFGIDLNIVCHNCISKHFDPTMF